MTPRATLFQAQRDGLAAIAAAKLNPPKADVDSGSKHHARLLAAKLGHELRRIMPKGASAQLVGRCRNCGAAVVFRPEDMTGHPLTRDFFGGSAVTKECRA